MAPFQSNIKDRELDKFKATPSNQTAVRVCVDSDTPVPVFITDADGENKRQSILNAEDRVQSLTWLDFGTKNQRVSQIDYTSATVYPLNTARKIFSYTLVGNQYRLDSISWVII